MKTPPLHRRLWFRVSLGVLAVLVVGRVAVGLWGRAHLDSYLRDTEAEWNTERARLAALRHPWDAAATESCGSSYPAADLGSEESFAVGNAILQPPRDEVKAEARALVEAHRAEIESFLGATRCGEYGAKADEAWAPYGPVFPTLKTSRLVVLDARMRAQAGDPSAAATRLLAVTKAGTDLAEGPLIGTMIGAALVTSALETLAPLIAEGRLSADDRRTAERELAALAPRMPALSRGLAKERLFVRWGAALVRNEGAPLDLHPDEANAAPTWSEWLVPTSAIFGDAASKYTGFLRAAEGVAERERDGEAFRVALERVEPHDASLRWSGLPLSASALTGPQRSFCIMAAWQKLVSAALAIQASGTVPEGLAAPIEDPCSPGLLTYTRSPDGRYTLASTGKDGIPSHDDVRIEGARAAATAP